MANSKKIAVTVITGFLGAGKTTFINNILNNNRDVNFALVENEFGEVGIDSKLIRGVEASHLFELKNGCICCTISNEYELALAELAEKFTDVDHLLIETTGIADPAPVIRPFFADEDLKTLYRFTGTVCLVDALNYHRYPAAQIALKQVASADFAIITKAEHFTAEQKKEISDNIRRINPLAETEFSDFGNVAGFSPGNVRHHFKIIPWFDDQRAAHEHISTQAARFDHPVNLNQFQEWLSYNLDIYKKQIYRVKGMLCFEGEPYIFVLQGVGGSFELTESEILCSDGTSELVFIGNLGAVELVYPY